MRALKIVAACCSISMLTACAAEQSTFELASTRPSLQFTAENGFSHEIAVLELRGGDSCASGASIIQNVLRNLGRINAASLGFANTGSDVNGWFYFAFDNPDRPSVSWVVSGSVGTINQIQPERSEAAIIMRMAIARAGDDMSLIDSRDLSRHFNPVRAHIREAFTSAIKLARLERCAGLLQAEPSTTPIG